MKKLKKFDAADYPAEDETIRHYLVETFREGNPDEIRLGNVARAMAVTTTACKAGVTRKALQRALSDEHVQYATIVCIVGAMRYTLTVRAAEQPKAPGIWQIAGARYGRKARKLRVEFALGVRYTSPSPGFHTSPRSIASRLQLT